MRHKRLEDIIAPNARNILLCVALSFLLFYDIFLPQTGEVVRNISGAVKSPLALLIEDFVYSKGFLHGKIIGLFLYLLLCFMLLRLNEVFSFIRIRTILPSFFCLITGGLLLRPYIFSSGIIVALLIFSAVFFSFKFLIKEEPRYAFNVSLTIFTAALFSFSCVWLLIVFWVFAYSSNLFTVRFFIASLLGALTPAFYAAVGFGLAGSENLLLIYIKESFTFFAVDFNFSLPEIIYIVLIGFVILASLADYTLIRLQENIKSRKEFSYIIQFFMLALILMALSVPDSEMLLWLSVVFGSFLLGRFFSLNNNLFTKILLWLYFGNSLLLLLFNRL